MSGVQSWDLDSNRGGGDKVEFTKLPEGLTRLRFVDEAPYQRWTHFLRAQKRSVNCPGRGCPICELRKQAKVNGLQPKYDMGKRFVMHVINRETKRLEMLEMGKTFIQDLKDLMTDLTEENQTLMNADIKVRRRGMGKDDTSYRLDIGDKTPMTEEDQKLLSQKVNFEQYFAPHDPEKILRVLNGEEWNEVFKREETPTTAQGNESTNDEAIGDEEDIEIS
jgi:hypothetical protein